MAPLDNAGNFDRQAVTTSIGTNDPETIDVTDASALPDPSADQYNVVIWDAGSHARPDQDPDVEIARVTGRDTAAETITISRGQEGTSNTSHPSSSELLSGFTAKMVSDLDTFLNELADFSASPTEVTADVNNSSVQTDNLSTTAPQDGNNQSASALWSSGFVVAVAGGGDMAWRDPTNFGNDDTAVQQCVDWIENNADNGIVHVPGERPDGTRFIIDNQVSTSDSVAVPVGFYLHGPGSQRNVENVVSSSITNGNAAFRISGDTGNLSVLPPVYCEAFDCQDNDCGFVEAVGTGLNIYFQEVGRCAGDAFQITGPSFDGLIKGGNIGASSGTTRGVVFSDNANGSPRDWKIDLNCPTPSGYDVCIFDDANSIPRIEGHYEGATGRALLDLPNSSAIVTPSTHLADTDASGGGARHAVYVDAENASGSEGQNNYIVPGKIGAVDGDGIHLGPNDPAGVFGTHTKFIGGISGDDINIESTNGSSPTVVPYEGMLPGSVTYPSAPRTGSVEGGATYYPDGWVLMREGTATISAGSSSTVEKFGGNPFFDWNETTHYATIDPNNTPSSDVEIQTRIGWNNADGQLKLVVEETTGNTSVDVLWGIYTRGV